jgi:putative nucleotidyltransferase with HDIG domain
VLKTSYKKFMTRQEALQLVKQKIQNRNLIKHVLAVEAVMRQMADYFGEDKERWGLAGLLHDIDYEETKDDMDLHSKRGAEMLKELGVDEEICQAVLKHNEAHGIRPESKIERALFISDPITGLIVAATLVLPSKKIADLTVENVLNRFREKGFARGANRDIIKQSEALLDLLLEKFVEISLKAMQGISQELGL